ncbi:MAG: LamG-like jellyroll fold domain-containing protein [bacterium]
MVVTISESNMKYYVNGDLHDSTGINPISYENTADDFYIGTDNDGGRDFDGQIQDVRIYNYTLSEKQIKKLAQPLVLHYKFDDKREEATENLITGGTDIAEGIDEIPTRNHGGSSHSKDSNIFINNYRKNVNKIYSNTEDGYIEIDFQLKENAIIDKYYTLTFDFKENEGEVKFITIYGDGYKEPDTSSYYSDKSEEIINLENG